MPSQAADLDVRILTFTLYGRAGPVENDLDQVKVIRASGV
jgi:hypothetical protein